MAPMRSNTESSVRAADAMERAESESVFGAVRMTSTGTSSVMRPASTTMTRSAMRATTGRSWLMNRRLTPRSRVTSSSRSRTVRWTVTSSAVVGSSAMSREGDAASVMARATR